MKPRRAVVFEGSIHADSVEDLLNVIRDQLTDARDPGRTESIFGGVSAGGRVVIDIDPAFTRERYFAELQLPGV